MKFLILTALLLVSTALAFADSSEETDLGVAEVQTLGALNGQALACRQYMVSKEAKALMIRHAPKTRRYGALFEMATNAAFVAGAKDGAPCPTEADLVARLAESAAALQAVFPEQSGQDDPEPLQSEPVESEPARSSDEGGS
jgi:hypothetical protein